MLMIDGLLERVAVVRAVPARFSERVAPRGSKGNPMAEAPVLDKLTSILRDVFDSDDLVATPELTAQKVEGWDSLGNVRLFLEIERVFSIRK